MPTVFITGIAGFIGRHVADACRRQGWTVVGMDRHDLPLGVEGHVHVASAECPLPPALVGRRFDAALLLAWPLNPTTYLESSANIGALATTLATAEAVLRAGCPILVAAGTCAEYAPPTRQIPLQEDHPVHATTLYAACKLAAHAVIEQLGRQMGATVTWARIFNPFGPGEPGGRLLPSIAGAVRRGEILPVGSGAQLRDYLHVRDVASALLYCLQGKLPGVVNICSGRAQALADLMRDFASACGVTGAVAIGARADRPWDPPFLVGDPTRLRSLGWMPGELSDQLREYPLGAPLRFGRAT